MKRFFKTSAIIACLAMLSVACDRVVESDDTVYEGTPIVPASSINNLFPGNGKIYVEWEVSDNENITSTVLSWDDGDGISGSYTVEGVSARDITEITIEDIPAGTYAVSLENACDIDVLTIPVSRSVTVFDEDTYKSSTAIEATQIVHDGYSATIYWEEAQEDCVGVIVTFKQLGSTTISSLLPVISGTSTLSGADASQDISYVTCYQPDIAIPGDYVEKSSTGRIPSSSPSSPTEVTVNPGDERIKVSWSLDASNTYFDHTIVEYSYSGGAKSTKTYYIGDSVDDPTSQEESDEYIQDGANVKYITGLMGSKDYTVKVYNCGVADDAISAGVTVDYISVYDLGSLQEAYEESMPTVTPTMINGVLYVSVAQSTALGSVDCDAVSFNYQRTASTNDSSYRAVVTITDFTEPYVITNAVEGSKYTYSATFSLPDGALDSSTVIDMHGSYSDSYSSWYTLPANEVVADTE